MSDLIIKHIDTTGIATGMITEPARCEDTMPSAHRLGRKKDGTLVLQGCYMWHEGWDNHGFEWRDIPTVALDE